MLNSKTSSLADAPQISTFRKYVLLAIFCVAQFIDTENISGLFSAVPTISKDLGITHAESTWVISATQLTFASFLLMSGRISDVYPPKMVFVLGFLGLGIVNLILGFMRNKIALFVLRAISGIFSALTIPSALNLIVKFFPEPLEQARAIGLFGGSGAIANILGLVIGALFVQFASWPWVFYFCTIISIPSAILGLLLIPQDNRSQKEQEAAKANGLDLVGISILTAALVLFIFALTTGSSAGWGTAKVLAPLVISVVMVVGFVFYESRIPESKASVPPRTWLYPNFGVLFAAALFPVFWWTTVSLIYTNLWQDVYGKTVISTAVHMLPTGIAALPVPLSGSLSRKINPKWIILFGMALAAIGSLLLPFGNTEDRYWRFWFPGMTIGTIGTMTVYMHVNIAIFRSTPPRIAGIVGAIYNSALQLGGAVGNAASTSIETSIENSLGPGGSSLFKGRAASLWFSFAVICVEFFSVLIFYNSRRIEHSEEEHIEKSEPKSIDS